MTAQLNTPRTASILTNDTPLVTGMVAIAAIHDETFNVADTDNLDADNLALQYVVHRTRVNHDTGCWIAVEADELQARFFGIAMLQITRHDLPERRITEECPHTSLCANPAHLVTRERLPEEEIPEDEWTDEDEANCTITYHPAR